MIIPNEPLLSKKGQVACFAITLSIMILVGAIVVNAVVINMVINIPPNEFTVVNKEHFVGNPPWIAEEYRMYYNATSYVMTDKVSFDKFQIGDWFNGTIIVWC
jgi:hypothetical protein